MLEYASTLRFKQYFPTKSILRNRDRNDDTDYSNDNDSYSSDSIENKDTCDNIRIKFALNNRVRFFDNNKSSSNILKCKSDSEICKIESPKVAENFYFNRISSNPNIPRSDYMEEKDKTVDQYQEDSSTSYQEDIACSSYPTTLPSTRQSRIWKRIKRFFAPICCCCPNTQD
ncbi:unnamed protein product [Gordionus sp. m RMFG-2023]